MRHKPSLMSLVW